MKYLLILFLASVAGIEFFYELSGNEAPGAMMCTISNDNMNGAGDVFRQHLDNHR